MDSEKVNGWTIVVSSGSCSAVYKGVVGTTGPVASRKQVEKWALTHDPEEWKKWADENG